MPLIWNVGWGRDANLQKPKTVLWEGKNSIFDPQKKYFVKNNEGEGAKHSCQPVIKKKVLLSLKKHIFEVKKSIFARRARITSAKHEVLSAKGLGPA